MCLADTIPAATFPDGKAALADAVEKGCLLFLYVSTTSPS